MMVSIEMTEAEIAQKMLSMNTGIPTANLIQSSTLTEDDLEVIGDTVQKNSDNYALNFSIDDSSETPSDVLRCIQRAVNDGYRLIVIDHLHELAFDERRSHISLQEAMGNFVKRLRNMAEVQRSHTGIVSNLIVMLRSVHRRHPLCLTSVRQVLLSVLHSTSCSCTVMRFTTQAVSVLVSAMLSC